MRSKLTSTILWPIALGVACVLLVAGSISTAKAELEAAPGFGFDILYANPNVAWDNPDGHTLREVINSFDFGPDGKLYYTTYIKDLDEHSVYKALLGFKVYRCNYDGSSLELIYSDENAFGVSGGRVFTIEDKVYFNDGATYDPNDLYRRTFDYYRYTSGDGITEQVLDSTEEGAPSIWGLSTWDGMDFLAAGRFGEKPNRVQKIYYSSLINGDLMPVMDLGVGSYASGSGPLAVDEDFNLYFCDGGYGDTHIWRFTANDVNRAMNNPANNPIDPADAHLFDLICDRPNNCPGPRGGSSMFIDESLWLVLTATKFHDPSELRRYLINDDGTNGGFIRMANSDSRMSETRLENGEIYVSDPDGIYRVYPTEVNSATVVIDGCDSGVDDRLVGCCGRISEVIDGYAATATNHGAFLSGVAHFTNDLKWAGIITNGEKGAIQHCAAMADIP